MRHHARRARQEAVAMGISVEQPAQKRWAALTPEEREAKRVEMRRVGENARAERADSPKESP